MFIEFAFPVCEEQTLSL